MPCAALPIAVARVTSGYGWRNRPSGPDLHTGIDLGAPEGTPVYATLAGRVVLSAPSGQVRGYGNVLVVQHAPQLYSLSAHLAQRSVVTGQLVSQGQQIGTVGRTAGTPENPAALFATSSPHLHLEYLDRWPPAGRDLNRLDVGKVFATLGIIAPAQGPLQRACSTSQAPNSGALPPTWPTARPTSSPQPTAPRSRTAAGLGLAALLALAAFVGSK